MIIIKIDKILIKAESISQRIDPKNLNREVEIKIWAKSMKTRTIMVSNSKLKKLT